MVHSYRLTDQLYHLKFGTYYIGSSEYENADENMQKDFDTVDLLWSPFMQNTVIPPLTLTYY